MFYPTRYMDATTDFGFKKIFASEESKPVLKSFLFHLLPLEVPIAEISFLRLEQLPGRPDERIGIYDIYCIDEQEQRFIVEMQKKKQDLLVDRLVYYSSFPIAQQAIKGSWNYELSPIYCLGILDFDLHPGERYIRYAKITDIHSGELYYDKLTFATVELIKFHLGLDELENDRDRWIYFLKHITDFRRVPDQLSAEPFRIAFEIAEIAAMGEDEQYYYQGSLKKMRDDYNSIQYALTTGRREGIEQGRAEGLTEGRIEGLAEGRTEGLTEGRQTEKIEIAQKLLEQGIPMDAIIQATGLTHEELQALTP